MNNLSNEVTIFLFTIIGSMTIFFLHRIFSISNQTIKNSTKLELLERQVSILFTKMDKYIDELKKLK